MNLAALKARFGRFLPALVATAALAGIGAYAAHARASDCCYPGASCCVPGAACCAAHHAK